jgi:hypothetical protein
MTKEILKQALEALESDNPYLGYLAAHAIRNALEEPGQEPTPWRDMVVATLVREGIDKHKARELADHFAAQPEQEPVARVAEVHMSRYTLEWTNGPLPEGTELFSALPVQPVQEPVAWRYHPVSPFRDKEGMHKVSDAWKLIDKPNQRDAHSAMCGIKAEPLYTAPPQRKPLTDEQVKELLLIAPVYAPDGAVTRTPFAYRKELLDTALWALRKAEAAHGIKEQS